LLLPLLSLANNTIKTWSLLQTTGWKRRTENSFNALQKTQSELQVDIPVTQVKLCTGHNEDKQNAKSEQVKKDEVKSGASKRKPVHISNKTPAVLLIEVRVDDKGMK